MENNQWVEDISDILKELAKEQKISRLDYQSLMVSVWCGTKETDIHFNHNPLKREQNEI